ncbi:MAG: DUF479 domain-containing protein [Acidobacteria bacterium]|nr:DUF479 domain-containing protein [Acidobacteriota bacterium]
MNYLVHFLMSGDDEELRLGNLLGDLVKGGVQRYRFPGVTDRMRTGIQLHRTIDSFSDRHPAVGRSKRLLAPRYGRLAGVIVDVFYDHVLARTWPCHSAQPLPDFTREVYGSFERHLTRLPTAIHPLARAMRRGDWLGGYAHIAGIDGALRGMAQRAPVAAGIGTAAEELVAHQAEFEAHFEEFLPDLRAACDDFLATRPPG